MTYKTNKPLSPAEIRKESTGSVYHMPGSKATNWYRRNVQKTMPPTEYEDSVDDAIAEALLP